MLYEVSAAPVHYLPLLQLTGRQVHETSLVDRTGETLSVRRVDLALLPQFLQDHKSGSLVFSDARTYIKELLAQAARSIQKLESTRDPAIRQCYLIDVTRILLATSVATLSSVVEGLYLGFYQPKSRCVTAVEQSVSILLQASHLEGSGLDAAQALLVRSQTVAEMIVWARIQVNKPGNQLRPSDFVQTVERLMAGLPVEVCYLTLSQLKTIGMGGLVQVGESSQFPPYLLILRYRGGTRDDTVTALVGKGVTCDTGGYCLKSAENLLGIRGDMAGAAAVAGAIHALATNQVAVNVTGVIPLCENRISPASLLPGDVIESLSGRTIEIVNTDAEGRLILADAITYAIREEQASAIVDIATLTGAVAGLLGFTVTGAMSDHPGLISRLQDAAAWAADPVWLLPGLPEHARMIESDCADIKNLGGKTCGTLTAGLFLRAFAEGRPWLHLDIAGTAWIDSPVFEFQSKGATGTGVATLYYLFDPSWTTTQSN